MTLGELASQTDLPCPCENKMLCLSILYSSLFGMRKILSVICLLADALRCIQYKHSNADQTFNVLSGFLPPKFKHYLPTGLVSQSVRRDSVVVSRLVEVVPERLGNCTGASVPTSAF